MSIASELQALQANLDEIKETITAYGGTVSANAGYADISSAIDTIPNLPFKAASWSRGSDAQIASMLASHYAGEIDIHDYWNVGDERVVHINAINTSATGLTDKYPAQDLTFVLANSGGKKLSDGTTDCAFIVVLKHPILDIYGGTTFCYMNTSHTTQGGWNSSPRRTWCNGLFRDALPSSIQGIFKQHINQASQGRGSTTLDQVTDYFALPAAYNVSGSNSYGTGIEDNVWWTYYQTGDNRKVKQTSATDATTITWWTRSPAISYDYDQSFLRVNTSGSPTPIPARTGGGLMVSGCI